MKTIGVIRLNITPDGKWVLVSGLRSGDLYINDVASTTLVKQLNPGKG